MAREGTSHGPSTRSAVAGVLLASQGAAFSFHGKPAEQQGGHGRRHASLSCRPLWNAGHCSSTAGPCCRSWLTRTLGLQLSLDANMWLHGQLSQISRAAVWSIVHIQNGHYMVPMSVHGGGQLPHIECVQTSGSGSQPTTPLQ